MNGHAVAHVAAGDYHSVAVSKCGHHLWMWGNGKAGTFCDPFVKYLPYPTEVEEVNQWLHHEHKSIKDVKAAGDSTVVLTSDNELWGWGGNEYGQLANNHDRLMLAYKGVYEPYHITGYDGTIKGFDLSSDVIVFWTGETFTSYFGLIFQMQILLTGLEDISSSCQKQLLCLFQERSQMLVPPNPDLLSLLTMEMSTPLEKLSKPTKNSSTSI